ncbi:MAG: hypothetical protein ABIS27_08960 [Longimicrobiales bacterium]
MSTPFVSEVRAAGDLIVIGGGDGSVLHLRVQAAELWDTIRVDAPGSASVKSVKKAAVEVFSPMGADTDEFVVKLRGFEILHEDETLEASGAKNGSTLLIERRRRRPVR